jgi:chorismate mutase
MGEIEDFRLKIDELDRQLVRLISERARAAQEIGKLKRATSLPVYEPKREHEIYENVRQANTGPLPDIELVHIYERIIDVMRSLQKNELASQRAADSALNLGKPALDSANDSRKTGK